MVCNHRLYELRRRDRLHLRQEVAAWAPAGVVGAEEAASVREELRSGATLVEVFDRHGIL